MRAITGAARLAAALGTALLLAPARATATGSPACRAMGVSPRFATDRTLFCATYSPSAPTRVGVYRSTDRGRSWQSLGVGDSGSATAVPTAVYVDQRYPAVRDLYVLTGAGLFASVDGAKPVLVAAGVSEPDNIAPFVDTVDGVPVERTQFAVANPSAAVGGTILDPALDIRRPVPGGPAANYRFVVAADFASSRRATVIARDPGTAGSDVGLVRLAAFACTGDFTCAQRTADFGDANVVSAGGGARGMEWLVLRVALDAASHAGELRIYRSADSGMSWTEWTELERVLPHAVRYDGADAAVAVSSADDAPGRFYARVLLTGDSAHDLPAVPASQLFVSGDAGRSWTRSGFARAPGQRGGAGGSLPFNAAGTREDYAATRAFVQAAPGGRLYVLGAWQRTGTFLHGTFGYAGLFCSADQGRTWRRGGC
jgi:hypothetical protein